jgi:DNA primase
MALPPAFLDELRQRTPLPALIGRRVKLTRSARDWRGCCPFHNEKTPSFYVYQDHYHCFGCGAHGDAIGFVMQSQGAGFVQAVEVLAAEAGLGVPRATPEAAAAERRRSDLHDVLKAADAAFQCKLHMPEGRAALDYLRGRGLSDETIARYGLGFSGSGRGALASELSGQGIELRQLVDAGLMKQGEDGRTVDLFFNRATFPIRDPRGRTISFGGRILGDGQPKYLNGPETTLFSKRRTLYGLDLANALRRERGRGAPSQEGHKGLIVVEGYMDVIALAQAGFAAVAPLGTALTAEQLEALWEQDDRPVFCFDGDAAGRRAGIRTVGLALPMLAPNKSLGVIVLPEGEDPDSVIRRGGRLAFQDELAREDLGNALYGLLKDDARPATPEGWAAFRNRLVAEAGRIPDRSLAAEYRSLFLDRFFAQRRRAAPSNRAANTNSGAGFGQRRERPQAPVALGARPRVSELATEEERGRVLVAILLAHPTLLPDLEESFALIDLPPALAAIRGGMGDWLATHPTLDSQSLWNHLDTLGLAGAASAALDARPLPACAMAGALPAEAADNWRQIFGLMRRTHAERELAEQQLAFERAPSEATERRLVALAGAVQRLRRGDVDGTG